MGGSKGAVKAVFWVYAFAALSIPLGYLYRITLARNLTPEEYGIFYAILGLFSLMTFFGDFGLSEALVYFMSKFRAKQEFSKVKQVIIITFLFQFLFLACTCGLILVFSDQIGITYLGSGETSGFIRAFLVSFVGIVIMTTLVSIYRGLEREKSFSSMDLLKNVIAILVTGAYIYYGASTDLVHIILIFGMSYLVVDLIYGSRIFSVAKNVISERSDFDKKTIVKFFRCAGYSMVGTGASVLLVRIDILLVTFFLGAIYTGYYTTAFAIVSLSNIFLVPFSQLFQPKITRLYHSNKKKEIGDFLGLFFTYISIGIIPAALTFVLFPEVIVRIFFGEGLINAAIPLRILGIGIIMKVYNDFVYSVNASLGLFKERSKVLWVAVVLNIILDIIMIPLFGILGAAIATSLIWSFMFFYNYRSITKKLDLPINYHVILKTLICNTIFIISVSLLKGVIVLSPILEALIVLIVSGTIYLLVLFVLRAVSFSDLVRLGALFR